MTSLAPHSPWDRPPTKLALPSGEVHVWLASLDAPEERVRRLAETLSADERQHAARYHFDRHRQQFTAARCILRAILGRYLKCAPARLAFEHGPMGKPGLAPHLNTGNLRFNLSHADGLALVALAPGREIGVDIERNRELPDTERLAQRFFSPREREVIRQLPARQRLEAFYACWSRKEAFIKATGEGLSRALDSFDVSVAPGEPPELRRVTDDTEAARPWTLRALAVPDGYAAAIVVAGRGFELRCWTWSW